MKPFLTSLGQARTSPPQRLCSMAFQRPQCPRIVGPTTKFARCSSVRRRSRQKVCCPNDVSPTPASVRPRCAPLRMHLFTRHRQAAGSTPLFRCINISTTTATHATPSTPAGVPTTTQEKEPTTAIILDVADATTVVRTRAPAPACQALRPSAVTSSTQRSHQGINHLPTSLSTPRRQTLDFGLKTIGLHVRPVVRVMTISLFAISHYSWLTRREHGWSTYRPMLFKVGRI